ncbi:YggT family protein [Anaerocolumna sp. MB42-C2]|uniref:YggT family protein n=1 Tax=Anaerocolumna sp. MB42-C2 TaxID=3070997 RepID=UPI0027E20A32|nr:YggT family protein [Anaerocolumna sp. MB42-C2]WMJ88245.1 YggT family protein [Anaerocolumna sp. MB42-C2]
MINRMYDALYIFFIVLEIVLFLYVITSWFPVNNRFKSIISFLIDPILVPVRYLLKHSIFNTPTADLSPVIGFVVILFLQEFFYVLK